VRTVAQRASRIVVKVGSSILTAAGAVRPRVFTELIRQVSGDHRRGPAGRRGVVGRDRDGQPSTRLEPPGRSIPEKQAAAAVGQIALMERYRLGFARRGAGGAGAGDTSVSTTASAT
jgi:glutamate 5-kinase